MSNVRITFVPTTKTQIMNNKVINGFIQNQISLVQELFNEKGSLVPLVNVLTEKNGGYYDSHIPVPIQLMKDEDGKDFVRDKLIEQMKEKIKKDGHNLLCINWCSEGWMYKVNKQDEEGLKNYRSKPKTEVLLMVFNFEDVNKTIVFEIKRNQVIDDKGQLKEQIKLEVIDTRDSVEVGGRFSDMLNSKN